MLIAETTKRQLNPTRTLPRNLKVGIFAKGKLDRTTFNQPTAIPQTRSTSCVAENSHSRECS
jgi:hypothetical protein